MRNLLKMFETKEDVSLDTFAKAIKSGQIVAYTPEQVADKFTAIDTIEKAITDDLSGEEKDKQDLVKAEITESLKGLVKKRIVNNDGVGNYLYIKTVPEIIIKAEEDELEKGGVGSGKHKGLVYIGSNGKGSQAEAYYKHKETGKYYKDALAGTRGDDHSIAHEDTKEVSEENVPKKFRDK